MASRTTPTLCVFVMATGVVSWPDSRTHSRPVSSPLPLSRWQPANTGSAPMSACGTITVTPVRTGPSPDHAADPRPRSASSMPTVTPSTSVMALRGPGREQADGEAEVAVAGHGAGAYRPAALMTRRSRARRRSRAAATITTRSSGAFSQIATAAAATPGTRASSDELRGRRRTC